MLKESPRSRTKGEVSRTLPEIALLSTSYHEKNDKKSETGAKTWEKEAEIAPKPSRKSMVQFSSTIYGCHNQIFLAASLGSEATK